MITLKQEWSCLVNAVVYVQKNCPTLYTGLGFCIGVFLVLLFSQ